MVGDRSALKSEGMALPKETGGSDPPLRQPRAKLLKSGRFETRPGSAL
jgi:hypothetical protein